MRHLLRLISRFGRAWYGLALLGFGIEQLVLGAYPKGLLPVPSGLNWTAYAVGPLLLLSAGGLLAGKAVRPAVAVPALLFGVAFLALHLPKLGFTMAKTGAWTPAFEVLALAAGALVLAAAPAPRRSYALELPAAPNQPLFRAGQLLFAASLLVFGVLHFLFAQFVATLVPAWIPGHLFWAYFVGVAFLATALSLVLRRQVGLATGWLGGMFSLWVLLLHGPRVAQKPTVEAEWTSLLVALAMSGAAYSMSKLVPRASTSETLAPEPMPTIINQEVGANS